MICGGRTVQPAATARTGVVAATDNPRGPSDEQVVKGAFTAHLKGNPKLKFDGNKWKKATVSKGKPSDRNWTKDEYSIKDNGTNEYLVKHTHNYYKPSVKSMKWLEHDTHYYLVKVSVQADGKQKYEATKYKGFYTNRVRKFSFVADTKTGRVLVPVTHRTAIAGNRPSAPKIRNFRCSITAVDKNTLLGKDIIHSKNYRAAVLTNKGLYHIKATFETGLRKYFITDSKKWGGNWTRHGRYHPAPTHITKMFNHACRQYIKVDLRK